MALLLPLSPQSVLNTEVILLLTLCYFIASVLLMTSIPTQSISQNSFGNLNDLVPHNLCDLTIVTLCLSHYLLSLLQT